MQSPSVVIYLVGAESVWLQNDHHAEVIYLPLVLLLPCDSVVSCEFDQGKIASRRSMQSSSWKRAVSDRSGMAAKVLSHNQRPLKQSWDSGSTVHLAALPQNAPAENREMNSSRVCEHPDPKRL